MGPTGIHWLPMGPIGSHSLLLVTHWLSFGPIRPQWVLILKYKIKNNIKIKNKNKNKSKNKNRNRNIRENFFSLIGPLALLYRGKAPMRERIFLFGKEKSFLFYRPTA